MCSQMSHYGIHFLLWVEQCRLFSLIINFIKLYYLILSNRVGFFYVHISSCMFGLLFSVSSILFSVSFRFQMVFFSNFHWLWSLLKVSEDRALNTFLQACCPWATRSVQLWFMSAHSFPGFDSPGSAVTPFPPAGPAIGRGPPAVWFLCWLPAGTRGAARLSSRLVEQSGIWVCPRWAGQCWRPCWSLSWRS